MSNATPQRIPTRVETLEVEGPLDTPCYVWQGYIGNQGYPVRTRRRGMPTVNREIYELAYGAIPAGYQVHHICREKRCIRLDHLECLPLIEHRARHRTFNYEEAASLWKQGWSYRQIGRAVGATRGAVQRAIGRMRDRGEL